MRCFTSITNNYLPKARLLGNTVKRHNPDWTFDVVFSEPPVTSLNLEEEPFDNVITLESLAIPDWKAWTFKHRVVETCTAVKGFALVHLLETTDTDKVVYLDPDIAVFNSLQPLTNLLDRHAILLTPHQTRPATGLGAIVDNEICSLKHGIYNLGFFAVRREGQGRAFAEWWRERLLHFCYDAIPDGLFTDQRWCDLAPAFFDDIKILRCPEYNVATWNLDHRSVTLSDRGTILVDGQPLRFYHFTGYDSGAGPVMVNKYAAEEHIVRDLWEWYSREIQRLGQSTLGSLPWAYDFFANGERITPPMRRLYRSRNDLQRHFPDPFDTDRKDGGFYAWCMKNMSSQDKRTA